MSVLCHGISSQFFLDDSQPLNIFSMPAIKWEIKQIAELRGHLDRVWAVAWNPKRSLIVSCSGEKTVRLYSYYTLPISEETSDILLPDIDSPPPMKLVFTLSSAIPTGHTKTVRSVAWAPSGKTFATASFDSNIGIWEQEEDNDDVYGFDLELGESGRRDWGCVSTLEGHETECKCVAYSSMGTLLASCSRDKTVWVWEGG